MKKIIYLASFRAILKYDNVTYQDINGNRDIDGCMLNVELSNYDILIATPPCNYYSRANYRREISDYSQKTKHLLPAILKKFIDTGKPFIVENVRNPKLFNKIGLFELGCFIYHINRHTYFSSHMLPINSGILKYKPSGIENKSKSGRQGGAEVNDVIELFIDTIL